MGIWELLESMFFVGGYGEVQPIVVCLDIIMVGRKQNCQMDFGFESLYVIRNLYLKDVYLDRR